MSASAELSEFALPARVHPLAILAAVLLHVIAIALLFHAGHVAPRPVTVTVSLASLPAMAAKAVGPAAPATAAVPPPPVTQPVPPAAPLTSVIPPPAAPAQSPPQRLPLPPPAPPPARQRTARPLRAPPPVHAATPERTPPHPIMAPASRPAAAAAQAASVPGVGGMGRAAASQSAVSSSWSAAISAWLDQHKFYPDLAERRDQQGTVLLRFVVARDGRVRSVLLLRTSGFAILDRAAVKLLSGARLPPFPPDMPGTEATVTVPIRYLLQ